MVGFADGVDPVEWWVGGRALGRVAVKTICILPPPQSRIIAARQDGVRLVFVSDRDGNGAAGALLDCVSPKL